MHDYCPPHEDHCGTIFLKLSRNFTRTPRRPQTGVERPIADEKHLPSTSAEHLLKIYSPNLGCRAFCLPKSIGPSIADRGGAYVENQAIHGPSVEKHKHGQQVAAENRATKRLRALVMREIGAVTTLSCYSKFSDPDN